MLNLKIDNFKNKISSKIGNRQQVVDDSEMKLTFQIPCEHHFFTFKMQGWIVEGSLLHKEKLTPGAWASRLSLAGTASSALFHAS